MKNPTAGAQTCGWRDTGRVLAPCPTPSAHARNLGLPFSGQTGSHNAITDVPDLHAGHVILIEGEKVHTGVTALLPRGKLAGKRSVPAAWFALNGNGGMTGTAWTEELGWPARSC